MFTYGVSNINGTLSLSHFLSEHLRDVFSFLEVKSVISASPSPHTMLVNRKKRADISLGIKNQTPCNKAKRRKKKEERRKKKKKKEERRKKKEERIKKPSFFFLLFPKSDRRHTAVLRTRA